MRVYVSVMIFFFPEQQSLEMMHVKISLAELMFLKCLFGGFVLIYFLL